MKNIDEICEIIRQKMGGELYLSNLMETKDYYYIFLADQYGNESMAYPICVDKNDGSFLTEDESSFDSDWVYHEIPEAFHTYKCKVIKRILEEPPAYLAGLDEDTVMLGMNVLYDEHFVTLTLPQLYAVACCFLALIAEQCSGEEHSDYHKLTSNEQVDTFLRLPLEEKLQYSHAYYWRPKCFETFINEVERMENGLERLTTPAQYNQIKKRFLEQQALATAELDKVTDAFCDTAFLKDQVTWIGMQAADGFAACEGAEKPSQQEETRFGGLRMDEQYTIDDDDWAVLEGEDL